MMDPPLGMWGTAARVRKKVPYYSSDLTTFFLLNKAYDVGLHGPVKLLSGDVGNARLVVLNGKHLSL
jgi:hypothetical protein